MSSTDLMAISESCKAALNIINFSHRKVGGIRFVRIGRFCFSFCVTRKVPRP